MPIMTEKKFVETTLVMSEEEREWLSGYLQNAITGNEDTTTEKMRAKFWKALNPIQNLEEKDYE